MTHLHAPVPDTQIHCKTILVDPMTGPYQRNRIVLLLALRYRSHGHDVETVCLQFRSLSAHVAIDGLGSAQVIDAMLWICQDGIKLARNLSEVVIIIISFTSNLDRLRRTVMGIF